MDAGLTMTHYLVLSSMLFSVGVLAVTFRKNAIGVLIGIELMLNGANINLVAFSRYGADGGHIDGAVFAVFVIMLAAAEAAVALAIILNVFHHTASIDVDDYTEMSG